MAEPSTAAPGFEMSEKARRLRGRVHEFIEEKVIPLEPVFAASDEEAEGKMSALQEQAKAEGLWALGLPKEIGGGGLSFMDYVHVNEVVGRSEPAMFALGTHSAQDATMLHLYGTEEQKERWLGPLVRGEILPSIGMTEPDAAGSDPTLIRTTAVLENGEWLINGHKWFTTLASRAAFTTVFCITDPEAAPHRRASMIVVPTSTDGYEVVRVIPTMGGTDGDHCEIRLTNVRVPEGNLLGGRGEGFVIGQKRLGPGRIYHAMRWLGQAQRAFDLMCRRAKERFSHGSLLSEKQSVQNFIADSAAEIQAARLITLDAARKLDAGGDARVEIALIKFHGAQMLHNVIDRAIQVHGSLGVTADTPLESMYRHARYARIYDGPDEVHRQTVARRLLKLYDEAGGYWDPTSP